MDGQKDDMETQNTAGWGVAEAAEPRVRRSGVWVGALIGMLATLFLGISGVLLICAITGSRIRITAIPRGKRRS